MQKDEIKEIKVFSGEVINIKWSLENADGSAAPLARAAVEYSTIGASNSLNKQTNPVLGYLSQGDFNVTGLDGLLQIKCILSPDTTNSESIRLKLAITSSTGLIDSGITYVEAIGHFGAVKRKLVAEVNRVSGSLIRIFDYTLYSQGNIE